MSARWHSEATRPTYISLLTVERGSKSKLARCFAVVSPVAAFHLSLLCLIALGCSKQAEAVQATASSPNHQPLTGTEAGLMLVDDIPRVEILPATDRTSGGSRVKRVDLGTIRQGERIGREIVIENRTPETVTIDRVEASCECMTLNSVPLSIGAGAEARIRVVVDESRDISFRGQLAIDVDGYVGTQKALRFQAWVRVITDPSRREVVSGN
jgi:Protein of unknown function (DUF1573)